MKIDNWLEGHWALILGASSGFGAGLSWGVALFKWHGPF